MNTKLGLYARIEALEYDYDGCLRNVNDLKAICTEFETELELHRADHKAIKDAGFESPGELLAAYKRQAMRYEWLKKWFAEGGARAEIDPHAHIRQSTSEIIDAGIDARLNQ